MENILYAKGESVHGPRVVAYLWGHGNYRYSIEHIEYATAGHPDPYKGRREIDVVKINGSYETAMEIFDGEIMPDTTIWLPDTGES